MLTHHRKKGTLYLKSPDDNSSINYKKINPVRYYKCKYNDYDLKKTLCAT